MSTIIDISEREFLKSLSRRDQSALEALVKLYFPILCRFAEKFLPDAAFAKDIVQETFIRFWSTNSHFESMNKVKSYLFTSTRNGCLNMARGQEREKKRHIAIANESPILTESVLTDIVRAENLALIYQAVLDLPPTMQEVFNLSYREGLTIREISTHLNISEKAVRDYKYRSLIAIRKKIGAHHGPLLLLIAALFR